MSYINQLLENLKKWKGYNNSFNSWIDKKDLIKWVSFFHHIEVLEEILK